MPSPGQYMKGVTSNSPLPPSVEAAYYKKCIALKRRIAEIEAHNDEIRQRKLRIDRAILKMRLERALLLDQLGRRTDENVDDSDLSDSPPPTPTERPLRAKRGQRRPESPATTVHPDDKPESDSLVGKDVKLPKAESNSRFEKSSVRKRARSSGDGIDRGLRADAPGGNDEVQSWSLRETDELSGDHKGDEESPDNTLPTRDHSQGDAA